MDKIYVLKLYVSACVKPIVAEVFPNTDDGRRDAEDYATIMTRNSEYTHMVVIPARFTLECAAVSK